MQHGVVLHVGVVPHLNPIDITAQHRTIPDARMGAEPHVAAARFVDAAPQGPNAEQRLREIRRRIQAVLVYPPLARSDALEGMARVRFDIERDGTPRSAVVHRCRRLR